MPLSGLSADRPAVLTDSLIFYDTPQQKEQSKMNSNNKMGFAEVKDSNTLKYQK